MQKQQQQQFTDVNLADEGVKKNQQADSADTDPKDGDKSDQEERKDGDAAQSQWSDLQIEKDEEGRIRGTMHNDIMLKKVESVPEPNKV